jgi:hypothetical protein
MVIHRLGSLALSDKLVEKIQALEESILMEMLVERDDRIEELERAIELGRQMAEWHLGDNDECGVVAREFWALTAPERQ